MAKKKNKNKVHTFGKLNKYIIFFGMLAAVLNLEFLMNAAWGVIANQMVEGLPVKENPAMMMTRMFTTNILIVFGVAALLIQLNHTFARKDSKAIFGVTVVSAGLLLYIVVSSILMFVEV